MLKYKGLSKPVNSQPEGEWIKISVENLRKEWGKQSAILVSVAKYWATEEWKRTYVPTADNKWDFYAWISLDKYEKDIEEINKLVSKLKKRGDDVQVFLIEHSEGLKGFFDWLWEQAWSPHDFKGEVVLDPVKWEEWLKSHQIEKRQKVK